jgi:UDP-N-acetylmuramate dehydrogenase
MFKKFIKSFCNQCKYSNISINKNLKHLTTFKIDAIAKVYIEIKCIEDLFLLFGLVQKLKIKTICLGGGSKVLLCKKRLNFIVYTLAGDFEKIYWDGNDIIVGSGVSMSKLCNFCNQNNLSCVEWGLGIPCKIGGGVYTNTGCFGKCFGDIVRYVIYTDGKKIFIKHNKDCEFTYRKSFFYGKNYIILFVVLKSYKSQEDIKAITLDNFNKKVSLQPYNYPSVGSIFKSGILPAPIFIEKFGLKGLKIGEAEVSTKHCGFIINKKNAKARDVLKIICKIKKTVWKKSGIILYNEVILLGEKKNGFLG